MIKTRKNQELLNIVPVAVYTTDAKGLITYYNDRAAELWGKHPRLNDPSELPFYGSWKLFDTEGNPLSLDEYPMARGLRHQKGVQNEEIVIEQPDGTRIFALVNVNPLFGADGKLTGAINVFHDITFRKAIENENKWLAAIIESSGDAIASKNLDGIITSWNKGAEKMFGYTQEEAVGKPITILIPPERHEEEDRILRKIRNGEKIGPFETIRLTKNGESLHISVTISPIKNTKGEVIGASKIARDITDQVQLKQQLHEYNQKLLNLNKEKDQFISQASHELKTPITSIKAYLQLIERDTTHQAHKNYVSKALNQVEKLTNLIMDMLDVSRIQERKLPLNYTSFNLNELIDDCIESIQFTQKQHQIIRECCPDSLIIKADKQRIDQVMVNLLTNAIRYSPQADKVIVKALKDNGSITVSVQDFGVGIPHDKLDKIFTRFFRIENGTFSPGLGIGLFIARELISMHNGKLWVESEPGKGSTFYFRLPLEQG